jgi:hypothetical protein
MNANNNPKIYLIRIFPVSEDTNHGAGKPDYPNGNLPSLLHKKKPAIKQAY